MRDLLFKILHIEAVLLMVLLLLFPFVIGEKEVAFQDMKQVTKTMLDKRYQQEDRFYIRKYYHLNEKMYTQAAVYTFASAMEAQEVAIFYEPDSLKRKLLKEKIAQRKEVKAQTFKGYQEAKYQMIENGIIVEISDYVCLFVDEDALHLKQAVKELFL